MLNVITGEIIGTIIQNIAVFTFIRTILEDKNKIISLKNVVSFSLLSVLMVLLYGAEYSSINPLALFLAIVFGLFGIYKLNISKAFLCSGFFMITLFLADVIVSILLVSFFNIQDLRTMPINIILSNSLVCIITIVIVKIPVIKNKIIEIIKINENKKNIEAITFIVLSLAALSLISYITSRNYLFNKVFIIAASGIIIFIILTIIFFKEKYEKDKIINRYDELFEYVKTFEEWMDTENINIHESKNQLATLRDMVKRNKKAVQYIDNIIKERINTGSRSTEKLRYIPKGGLKGLLYYKITIAENNNITLFIDVSKDAEEILKTLTVDENKMLCRLVGIFFDNAIESSRESEKKMMSCEIYSSNNNLNITISNTFSGRVDLSKISENGYSTKGKNRGKGLYLAKKFSAKYDKFALENRIINDYYIQKIIIKRI